MATETLQIRWHGRGGQGAVYLATQLSTKRPVAIKVLLDGSLAREAGRRRFEREIELVSALRHPNIVRVYDSGVATEDRPYFVMEHIDGAPLDECVVGQPAKSDADRSVTSALQQFVSICDAVKYAHQHGVIHRDLKPGNILIDSDGQPHVVDFGIARPVVPGATDGSSNLTATGGFVGTLAYASPEQITGDPLAVDTRTDVYALGIILYLMLTGRPPYAVGQAMADAVKAIVEVQPPPPSTWTRKETTGGERGGRRAGRIDHELDTVVLKALAKRPDDRYPSVEALQRDVEHYLGGEPIEAKRDSAWYVLRKTLARYKTVALLCAAIGALSVVFAVAMFLMYQDAAAISKPSLR